MDYRITLKGHLFLYEPDKERRIVMGSPTPLTPAQILQKIGIPVSEIYMVASGGKQTPLDVPLSDEQDVELFPVIAGG